MSAIGKELTTLEKKSGINSNRSVQGTKKLVFWHQASGGEKTIDFNSLNPPAYLATVGISNPSLSEIISSKLGNFKESVQLISYSKGTPLALGDAFDVQNNKIVLFDGYAAEPNEIFEIRLETISVSSNLIVDGRKMVATGTIPANTTDFNTGEGFNYNENPSQQIGSVLVVVDGIQQFRCIGNNLIGEGNYIEVPNSGNWSSLIRMKEVVSYDRSIAVYSMGTLIERPNISLMQRFETIGGQLDTIIPVIADLTSRPESDFRSAPNEIDLRQFGTLVLQMKNAFNELLDKLDADSGVNDTDYKSTLGLD